MGDTLRRALVPADDMIAMASGGEESPQRGNQTLERIPAALLAPCDDCGLPIRRSQLREFGQKHLCPHCFEGIINAAEDTKQAVLIRLNEPDRVCSRCAAIVDPAVGSEWCGVFELGDTRAVICENFVPLELRVAAEEASRGVEATDCLTLWSAVCAELAESLGPTHLDWLANTTPECLQDRILRIAVPDEYTRSWLVARLMPAISQALDAIGFANVSVEFVTGTAELNGSVPKKRVTKAALATLPLAPAPPVQAVSDPPATHRGGGFSSAFSFEQFVVGTGNRLAHAGALAVAEGSSSYNPLFLYGGVGVGKTHLLQAIAGRCAGRGRQALYIASETFTNELISAIRNSSTADFRRRYRDLDVLLVDDIHFIIGKESTQEEFFHTFNWLFDNGKQIVLSSDRAPNEMRVLDQRLRSRFWWGLTADIQPPDFETRLEILRRKAIHRRRMLPDEVLAFLAGQNTDNVRELEGLLNRLLALSDIHAIEPSMALAASLLNGHGRKRELDHADIMQAVSAYFRVSPSAMSGKQRSRNISTPRHIAMYLMREDAKLSLPHIGDVLGGRDHSTVIYGCDRIGKEMAQEGGRIRHDVEAIRGLLFSC
jgi:chromosomal replication initiator protein